MQDSPNNNSAQQYGQKNVNEAPAQSIQGSKMVVDTNTTSGNNFTPNHMEDPNDAVQLISQQNILLKKIEEFKMINFSEQELENLYKAVRSEDIIQRHYGVIGLRKLLSNGDSSSIQKVIDAGLVPILLQFSANHEHPQLQLQSIWALGNIASGTNIQCHSIVESGGIPLIINLLRSDNPKIILQATFALGNISSDCPYYRDMIINAGGIQILAEIQQKIQKIDYCRQNYLKHYCWLLSNLCRGSPPPKYGQIQKVIPILCRKVANGSLKDKQIIADCFQAISYHLNTKSKVKIVAQSGITPFLVECLSQTSLSLLVPALRIVREIISVNQGIWGKELISFGLMDKLEILMSHHKKVVRMQVVYIFRQITGEYNNCSRALLSSQSLMATIIEHLSTDASNVKYEICQILSNLANVGYPQNIFNLICKGDAIQHFIKVLGDIDERNIFRRKEILIGLNKVLAHGEKFKVENRNPFMIRPNSNEHIDIFQRLKCCEDDEIFELTNQACLILRSNQP